MCATKDCLASEILIKHNTWHRQALCTAKKRMFVCVLKKLYNLYAFVFWIFALKKRICFAQCSWNAQIILEDFRPEFWHTRTLIYVFAHVWAYGIISKFLVIQEHRLADLQNFKLPEWKRSWSSFFFTSFPTHASRSSSPLTAVCENVHGQLTYIAIWGPSPD